jgi:aldose sugar dehydrogenase
MKNTSMIWAIILAGSSLFNCDKRNNPFPFESEGGKLVMEEVTDGILVPFGMAFLPNGLLLVTDRPSGKIFLVNVISGKKMLLQDVPEVLGKGDGGMLDIVVHPDYTVNGWIYFSYAACEDSVSTLVVERARLDGIKLIHRERLFKALPAYKEPNHFGSRMAICKGYLYITMGERYYLRDSAQHLGNHLGKIMRVHDDGRIPKDNPFVKNKKARPEIWSYGHRNPQGLAFRPQTGELWEHEHGPKGGDEVNIIRPSVNYGWPVICYGIDYDGKPIGEGITEKMGMEQPLYHYTPSIAPSGMDFYTSDVIPQWKGNLFMGALALKHLNRLVIKNNKIIREERLFTDKQWRIRNVEQGPDGFLYLGVDGGKIVRIRPA